MKKNILVVCAGDKSVHRVALTILRFLITKNQDFFTVIVVDNNKDIINLLKKKKLNIFLKISKGFSKKLNIKNMIGS